MIRVGTCSWTEKSLIKSGEFYPSTVKTSEERLRFYAEQFDTVEVDSSYYAMPSMTNAALWADRTPDAFIFHIKAYGALTGHGINPKTLPQEIRAELPDEQIKKDHIYIKDKQLIGQIVKRFRESITPLAESNKLGVVVYQFPPWFHYSTGNLEHIAESCGHMRDISVGVEFRHGSWLTDQNRDSVLSFLEQQGLTYISADEPQYGTLATIPYFPAVTSDIAYIRLHGRNTSTWLRKGVETSLRFAYEYSDEELKDLIPSIMNINKKAKQTYIMFNNCHLGFAMRNATRIKGMIREHV